MKNSLTWLFWIASLVTAALFGLAVYYFGWWALALVFGIIFVFAVFLAIIRNPIFGIYWVAFLLPFERIGSFELSGTTVRISQLVTLLAIFAWLFALVRQNKKTFAANPLFPWLCFLLAIFALSLINAVNLPRGVMVFIFIAFVMMVSITIPNLIKNKNQLYKIILILLGSALLVSVFGLYQFLGDAFGLSANLTGLREHYTSEVFGFPRIHSTAFEPLYFANYLFIPIGLSLSLFLTRFKNDNRFIKPLVFLGLLLLFSLNLILTLSRGGYLGLAICGLAIIIFLFKYLWQPQIILFFTIVIIASAFGAIWLLQKTGDESLDVFSEQATSFSSGVAVEERFTTYEQGWDLFLRHPILGIGVGNFGPQVNAYELEFPEDTGWAIVNNEYLELLTESGVFGLLCFLIIAAVLLSRSLKAILKAEDKFLKFVLIGLTAAFLGTLFQYLTFSTLFILHIWFLIGLIITCQNLILVKNEQ